jgi:hypothetical protein
VEAGRPHVQQVGPDFCRNNLQNKTKPKIKKPNLSSADEGFDGTYPTNVVVRNNGSCLYVPPGIFKSTCKIDITWFPFDDQRCEMKFGSWTYDGLQLDLQLQDDSGGDISSFITNGEWDLLGEREIKLTRDINGSFQEFPASGTRSTTIAAPSPTSTSHSSSSSDGELFTTFST